jgi:hypothetical protein
MLYTSIRVFYDLETRGSAPIESKQKLSTNPKTPELTKLKKEVISPERQKEIAQFEEYVSTWSGTPSGMTATLNLLNENTLLTDGDKKVVREKLRIREVKRFEEYVSTWSGTPSGMTATLNLLDSSVILNDTDKIRIKKLLANRKLDK